MLTKYVEKILKARVYDVAIETPLDVMPRLSRRLSNQLWLKTRRPAASFFHSKFVVLTIVCAI